MTVSCPGYAQDTSPPPLLPPLDIPTQLPSMGPSWYGMRREGVCVRPGEAPRVCGGGRREFGGYNNIPLWGWATVGGAVFKIQFNTFSRTTNLFILRPLPPPSVYAPAMEISINYAGMGDGSSIVVPGGGVFTSSRRSTARSVGGAGIGGGGEDGVVITPNPSGIVIKTRLMKKKGRGRGRRGAYRRSSTTVSRGTTTVPRTTTSRPRSCREFATESSAKAQAAAGGTGKMAAAGPRPRCS